MEIKDGREYTCPRGHRFQEGEAVIWEINLPAETIRTDRLCPYCWIASLNQLAGGTRPADPGAHGPFGLG